MPKWISIDRAIHKYEVKEEDLCLWAESNHCMFYRDNSYH